MRKTLAAVAAVIGLSIAGGVLGTGALVALFDSKSPSVTINKGDAVPTYVTRPTQLHIQNVTKAECDRMGGKYDARVVLCKNVDY